MTRHQLAELIQEAAAELRAIATPGELPGSNATAHEARLLLAHRLDAAAIDLEHADETDRAAAAQQELRSVANPKHK